MILTKKVIPLPLLLLMVSSMQASDLVSSSWSDLAGTLGWQREAQVPRVSDDKEVVAAVAKVMDSGDILVSSTFVAMLQGSTLQPERKKAIMLFLLAHEVAHKVLAPSKAVDLEYQADFLASIFVQSVDEHYDIAGTAFFNFAGEILQKDKTHGSAAERSSRLPLRADEAKKLATEFSQIMDDLNSGNSVREAKAEAQLKQLEDRLNPSGLAKSTGFGLAIAAAKHRVWLNTAPRKDLGVQVSLFLPAHPDRRRGSKGSKEIPGDKAKFYAASKTYKKYLEHNSRDYRARLNYLALIAYEGEAESKELFASLEKIGHSDMQWLNNMGVAAYVLAENQVFEKGEAIKWFEKAKGAQISGEAGDRQLEAKVLFNLSQACAQAGRAGDAADYMKRYRAHAHRDYCWANADLSCKGENLQPLRPDNLSGLKLDMTQDAITKVMKTSHKECTAGKSIPLAENINRIEYLCGSPQDKFRFVFTDGKATMIQYYGLTTSRAMLPSGENIPPLTVQMHKDEVRKRFGAPSSGDEKTMPYADLGLIILLDNGQKIFSIVLGDRTRMDKSVIGR